MIRKSDFFIYIFHALNQQNLGGSFVSLTSSPSPSRSCYIYIYYMYDVV